MVQRYKLVQCGGGQHQNSKLRTLLGVSVVVGRMCWAMIVTAGAGAEGFSSRVFLVRTGSRSR